MKTIDGILTNTKTCPEETLLQLGNIDGTVSADVLAQISAEYFEEFNKRYGSHVHILDWALHLDEATPHIHERHVFDALNQYVLKTHIVNYSKTRDVYVAYRKSGYSKKYLEEHEDDIIIHKAAKKAFDELGVKKLPTIKSLQVEFAELLAAKKEAYAELKKVRDELRDVAVHTANYEELRDLAERDPRKEKEHGRE